MYVADELIENLRKALDAHARTASYLELLSAASEILQQSEVSAEVTRVLDCEGDVWHLQSDGHWCLAPAPCGYLQSEAAAAGHGQQLEYINECYGPTSPVN